MRTVSPSSASVEPDLAGQPLAGDVGGEVEHVLLVLAGAGQPGEPLGIDDHMAGRAGHLALAGAFERHAGGLRDVEQARARLGASTSCDALAVGA